MDYPLDLRDLDKMVPVLEEADVVVAVRKAFAGYTTYRKLTSRVNRAILRLLFEPKLRDYNYTQLFRKEVLDAARPSSRSTVFLAPEIIIRAYEMGFRIKEVEIDFYPRIAGEATSGKPMVILRSVRDMFAFWLKRIFTKGARRITRRPQKLSHLDSSEGASGPGSSETSHETADRGEPAKRSPVKMF
jgi:hypothetical protein